MIRSRRPALLAASLVAALFAATPAAQAQVEGGGAGRSDRRDRLTFDLRDIDGGLLSSDALQGKILVVDVWGTWCAPCREMIPHLIGIQKQFGPKGVEVVGIAYEPPGDYDAAVRRVRAFAAEMGINYRLGMMEEALYEDIRRLMHFEGDQFTVPTTLILGRDGSVIARYPGYFFGQEKEIVEILNQQVGREPRSGNGGAGSAPADR